jgi:hypothetical protein
MKPIAIAARCTAEGLRSYRLSMPLAEPNPELLGDFAHENAVQLAAFPALWLTDK